MPLANQAKAGTNITITVVLRGMGAAPTFLDGGATFNSGDPTATFVLATGTAGQGLLGSINSQRWANLLDELERAWREGTATVS